MIEQLNVTNVQKLSAELTTGFDRLQALMQIGESRSAQVVSVVSQPVRAQTPAANSNQAAQTPNAASASSENTRTGVAENRAAASPQSQAAATAYRIRVQLQGQILDLVSAKPLPAGTQVQLTRTGAQNLVIQAQSQPAQSPQNAANPAPAPSTPAGTAPPAAPSTPPPGARAPATSPSNSTVSNTAAAPTRTDPGPQRQAATDTGAARPVAGDSGQASRVQTSSLQAAQLQQLAALLPKIDQAVTARVIQNLPLTTSGNMPQPPSSAASTPAAPTSPAVASAPAQPAQPPLRPQPTAPATAAPIRPNAASQPSPAPSPANGTTATPSTATVSAPQRVQLSIGGQTLEVLAPRPIPPGTEVRISRSADGQVTLQLPAPRALAVESALRQHLPRQQPPEELFSLLNQVSTSAPLRQAQPLLMSLISLLLGRTLTNPSQPDPEGVRQQLQQGGTLMEGKLARGDTQALPQDQKALLLKLAHQLQQPQPQGRELPATLSDRLNQLTQRAISRVVTNQIHSLGQAGAKDSDAEPVRSLVVDLPVQGQQGQHENVQLKITDQSGGGRDVPEQERRWQVELAFQMEGLPPFNALLTLENQQVNVIWKGEAGVRSLLQPHLGDLHTRLQALGLDVGVIGVREGRSSANTGGRDRSLIDVKT
ncbi:flagellar hook-length control protein FliK [Motiliproteus sediminis]|uniref:flagellar hook-length control protein FliK n=1 Tax=Motiliproteus sediminis TaxID=1468178 RepID=UPI001AF00510|nr:flagellar hook-length control protein FliK [Motiliproteus sediminis]